MSITTLLAFTPWPAVSASVLFILLVTALYLARGTAHQAISATANALSKGLRLASHSVAHAEQRLPHARAAHGVAPLDLGGRHHPYR